MKEGIILNIIKNQLINRNNINKGNELDGNEAIIACNHYIMEQLLRKGVTFKEMYPGVFIVTSLICFFKNTFGLVGERKE